jgi:hypothetical protein
VLGRLQRCCASDSPAIAAALLADAGADLRHGHGVVNYASGDRFEGEFRGGERHGAGRYTFADRSFRCGGASLAMHERAAAVSLCAVVSIVVG